MSGLLDQAGHFALLHRSKPGVLAGKDLAGIGGVLCQCILVHEGVMLGVLAFGWGVCGFAHKGMIMKIIKF